MRGSARSGRQRSLLAAASIATLAVAASSCSGSPRTAAEPAVSTQRAAASQADVKSAVADINETTVLVRDWYAGANPRVCDEFTDTLLTSLWGHPGATGRALCRKRVGSSQPFGDVVVSLPARTGAQASVIVTYTLDGARRTDEVVFVNRQGHWLADSVLADS